MASPTASPTPAPDEGTGPSDPAGAALLAAATRRGVMGLLGVEAVEAGPRRVVMRVTVDERVHQPYGILHGGVSALLAESAASYGGALSAPEGHHVVGIELNVSHLRAMRSGVLEAVATPVRQGRAIQVWEVQLHDDQGREICRGRCTLAVLADPAHPPAATPAAPPVAG